MTLSHLTFSLFTKIAPKRPPKAVGMLILASKEKSIAPALKYAKIPTKEMGIVAKRVVA